MASTATQFDTDCALMLHCDGSDASTTFTDSSFSSTKTVTANGNAQIDTAQSVFGGASGLFDGAGDYLSVPDASDLNFGTGDYTVDFRVRFNTFPSLAEVVLYSKGDSNADDGTFNIYHYKDGGYLGVRVFNQYTFTWTASSATWYHFAVTKASGTTRFFVDGTALTPSGVGPNNTISNTTEVRVAANSGNNKYLDGWIDELRVVKGTAVWTSNFTPPSAAYTKTYSGKINTINLLARSSIATLNGLSLASVATRDGLA